jgi:hypothetical protein
MASPAPEPAPEPAPVRPGDGGSRRRVTAVAMTLVAVHLVWMGVLLDDAYFYLDDFWYAGAAFAGGFDWDYLLRIHINHLMPLPFALEKVLVGIDPYNWGLTVAVRLALLAAAAVAFWRLLVVIFGVRWALLAPLTVYLFSPMTFWATQWWAASLNNLPIRIALPMMLAAHVLWLRTGRGRHLAAASAWLVFGLACFVKAAFLPLLAFALTWAFFSRGQGFARSFATALLDRRRAWTCYGILLVLYVALYLYQQRTNIKDPGLPSTGSAVEILRHMIVENFGTLAVGGPNRWAVIVPGYANTVADPLGWTIVAAWCVVAAVVVAGLRHRRRSAASWAILLGYVLVVNVPPVLLGRTVLGAEHLAGLETRYFVETAQVLALCLALAFLPLRGEPSPRAPSRTRQLVAGMCTAAFTANAIWSGVTLMAAGDPSQMRDYVAAAREDLADAPPGLPVFDRQATTLYPPFWPEFSTFSYLMGPLAGPARQAALRDPPPTDQPMVFGDDGHLAPMAIDGQKITAPDGGCHPRTGDYVPVPLTDPVPYGRAHVTGLGYVAGTAVTVKVSLGDGPAKTVPLREGAGHVYFQLAGEGDEITISPADGVTLPCVAEVEIGVAVPAG